ncbi:hypothetical protein L596_008798 [Steinernema carpocapsae]|uniref:Uncharacterized protein n=1 Tax=Steinernema carpocapsae TaxID=34508 RepID=A0A4U5PEP1_STECR|nr:hypothetical protein L596_008798 [Steinernema carpocapsae]
MTRVLFCAFILAFVGLVSAKTLDIKETLEMLTSTTEQTKVQQTEVSVARIENETSKIVDGHNGLEEIIEAAILILVFVVIFGLINCC